MMALFRNASVYENGKMKKADVAQLSRLADAILNKDY